MILRTEARQERFDKADFVFHVVFGSSESNQQYSDMSDSDIVWDSINTDDRRILHADTEEAREDSLWSRAKFKVGLEGGGSVVDFASDVMVDTDIEIATLLGEEL